MKGLTSQRADSNSMSELPFRIGTLLNPQQLAEELMTLRNPPALHRHAVLMSATEGELQTPESSLVPHAAQLAVHSAENAAPVLALTLQAGATQYRLLMPVLCNTPVAWLDECAATGTCLIAVDLSDTRQLALIQAKASIAQRRPPRYLVDVPATLSDALLVRTAQSVFEIATRYVPSLVQGFGVERVEVVVAAPSKRAPSSKAASPTLD